MNIVLRTATLGDAGFLTEVVIRATLAQGRFPSNINLAEYRAGYEDWTRETVLGGEPYCTLSVIAMDGLPVGRLRVVREAHAITLAGIQLLPEHQNKRIGSTLVTQLQHEAHANGVPLLLSVEKDNPNALRFYRRLGFVTCGESDDAYDLSNRA
jgi:ribosomal protein S18 acetylase RimI-like enzyme